MNGDGIYDQTRLSRIAKRIIGKLSLGQAFYRILGPGEISVIFSINSKKPDEIMGWMDEMLGKKDEIASIASQYDFKFMPDTIDTGTKLDGMTFSLCYNGDDSNMQSFIDELKKMFDCDEIKG